MMLGRLRGLLLKRSTGLNVAPAGPVRGMLRHY
jgi:hypothetical protein